MSYPERIVPDETEPGIVALHEKRYRFALPWCEGRRVLDAGCGMGYGSAILGQVAQRVLGVDVSAAAIEYARQRYARPNVEFAVLDLAYLDLPDASFDAICCFEAIEHFDQPERVLAEFGRVLVPGGTVLVSTPCADDERPPANPFHRTEWSPNAFRTLLLGRFREVELYGQRRLQTPAHRLAQRLDVLGLRRRFPRLRRAARLLGTAPMAEATLDDIVIERDRLEGASELVAVCRDP